jgi:hypothetical protein
VVDLQSISQPIIDRVIANAGKLGLASVASERPGGLVISITTPQMQPEAKATPGKDRLTIFLNWRISGATCTGSSRGYLLTLSQAGWSAEGYVMGIC